MLKHAVKLITYLFALFGDFLLGYAPPVRNAGLLIGGIKFFLVTLALILFQVRAAKEKFRPLKVAIISAAVSLLMFFVYYGVYNRQVLHTGNTRFVRGYQLDPSSDVAQYCSDKGIAPEVCETEFLRAWGRQEGIERRFKYSDNGAGIFAHEIQLVIPYFIFITGFCICIFSLTDLKDTTGEDAEK